MLNAAFAPELGPRFTPLAPAAVAGARRRRRRAAAVRPRRRPAAATPPVELLRHRHPGLGRAELDASSASPAAATSRGAAPRRAWSPTACARRSTPAGAPGDIVVLVRATASLRLLEEALEEQGLPTYVVGGRGYWSQEQVRDGLAWLRVLANPHDEEALLTVLSSPFRGAGTDELVLLAQAGRESGRGAWAALRDAAERRGSPPPEAERERLRGFARFSPPSASTPSARRSRCCSSARSSPPATTSPCSPAPAATGGSRTCAS